MNANNLLDRPSVGNNLVLHCLGPSPTSNELADKVRVDNGELTSESATAVNVRSDGFGCLNRPANLSSRCGRHKSSRQRVPHTLLDTRFETRPVQSSLRCNTPEMILHDTLAGRRPLKGGMGAMLIRELARCLNSSKVNVLEDLTVELASLLRVKRHLQLEEHILQTLYTYTNGATTLVARLCLGNRICHHINAPVQVLRENLDMLAEVLKVKCIILDIVLEHDATDDTHCSLLLRGVLDNLSTEVTALDGARIRLHVLGIDTVFVEDIWHTRFNLSGDHGVPDIASLHHALCLPLRLILGVKLFVFLAIYIRQARALVRVK
ncbi:hypothetical protein FR483_n767R [Paramecium bursaria Chlorella virus FR483]|uniref:Uncharacterized protein n767R n=1 Tax=Paramecium bursaria Chlorella virus FR483 TaxID=399781 RepID=A7J8C1_PBCVF|nr:hypothetical protein FR483_n767R [Paramecium bursaria Chlorella virus FR483]ABT16052.1 hypothetical protein FR483_n767R [Paramecium bursaria Chlorella virus FR483]